MSSFNTKGLLKKDSEREDKKEKKVQIIEDKNVSNETNTNTKNTNIKNTNDERSSDKTLKSDIQVKSNQERKSTSLTKDSSDLSLLTKEQLIKKVNEVKDKNRREIETQKNIILRQSDEIDEKDKIISVLSNQNKQLLKVLEELKENVDSKLDKVETKKIAEKIKDVKKGATMEDILLNKDKELKNAYKLIDILQKDKNDLTKNLNEKSEYSSVVNLEDQVKFFERKLSDSSKEIKFLKSIADEHKYCLDYKSQIDKNKKDFHEEIKLLKNKNKEMFMRWKEEENKLDKANEQYFLLRKEFDEFRHNVIQKYTVNEKFKETSLLSAKDTKFKDYLEKNEKINQDNLGENKKIDKSKDSKETKPVDNKKTKIEEKSLSNDVKKNEKEKITNDGKDKKKEISGNFSDAKTSNKKNQDDKNKIIEKGVEDKNKEEVNYKLNSQQEEKKLMFSSKLKEQSGNSEYYYLKMPKTSTNISSPLSEKGKNSNKNTLQNKSLNKLPEVNRSLGSLNQKHFSLKIKDLDEEGLSLFTDNEKRKLLEVIPIENLEIFEKRFEALEHSKYSSEQKYRIEAKKLQKKINELEEQLQLVDLQLKERDKKIKILHYQIMEHRNENKIINKKSSEYTKQIEIFNIIIREKEQENKFLYNQLQSMQHSLTMENYKKTIPKKDEEEVKTKDDSKINNSDNEL